MGIFCRQLSRCARYAVVFLFVSCGPGEPAPACPPNSQVDCRCPGGGFEGFQTCNAEGSGYSECVCSSDDGPGEGEGEGEGATGSCPARSADLPVIPMGADCLDLVDDGTDCDNAAFRAARCYSDVLRSERCSERSYSCYETHDDNCGDRGPPAGPPVPFGDGCAAVVRDDTDCCNSDIRAIECYNESLQGEGCDEATFSCYKAHHVGCGGTNL